MKNNILKTIAVATMLLLGSCSPIVLTNSTLLDGAALASCKTFVIRQSPTANLPRGVKQSDVDRLNEVVAAKLTAQGYREVRRGADMTVAVNYLVKLSKETSVDGYTSGTATVVANGSTLGTKRAVGGVGSASVGGGVSRSGTRSIATTATTEVVRSGVVILDIESNRSKDHLYYSQIKVDLKSNPLFLQDRVLLTNSVEKLFKKFPQK
ncbi:MAG: DUF4136 domain-containing protein [Rikenellaceae bacterium]